MYNTIQFADSTDLPVALFTCDIWQIRVHSSIAESIRFNLCNVIEMQES